MNEPQRASALLVGFIDAGPVELVREAGFNARMAPPWAALQAVREHECDLVIVRLTGAFRDVFEMIEGSRAEGVPVLAIVVNDERERERAWESGVSDCIVEPFGIVELKHKLQLQSTLAELRAEVRQLQSALDDTSLALDEARGTATLQSLQDDLTGVGNAKRLYTALELEWKRASRSGARISLLLADIDQFRLYNERKGRARGDDCLRDIAKALAAGVSRAGDLLVRFGGEEFVVLLPATSHEAALAVAQRLSQCVKDLSLPHEASTHGIVTVSIGVATVAPSESSAPASLLAAAEDALRAAKTAGRNRVVGRNAG
jgi:diguanylate cyclase (GGDEF)-like protein